MAQTERIFTTASSGRDRAFSFYGSSGSPIRAQATPTLPYAPASLLYHLRPLPARGDAVKRRASSRAARWRNAALLRRPGDRAIGRAVRRSMHKLIAARVEMTGHCAFGSFPVVFFIE